MKQNEQLSQPFFAQFLENQNREEKAAHSITKPWIDIYHTDKYPSDSDEEVDS
jgi:hypothetical protein